MPAAAKYRLAELAEADLLEIADHTRRRWGQDQQRRHIEGLYALFAQLAEPLDISQQCNDIAPGVRLRRYEPHRVYHQKVAGTTVILRVLHNARSEKRAFST